LLLPAASMYGGHGCWWSTVLALLRVYAAIFLFCCPDSLTPRTWHLEIVWESLLRGVSASQKGRQVETPNETWAVLYRPARTVNIQWPVNTNIDDPLSRRVGKCVGLAASATGPAFYGTYVVCQFILSHRTNPTRSADRPHSRRDVTSDNCQIK